MKITAITKFKHGELWQILSRLGWKQADLSKRTGIAPTEIGKIFNLRRIPNVKQADAIQKAFGEAGVYVDVLSCWPEKFNGFKHTITIEQTADVELDRLIEQPKVLELNDHDELLSVVNNSVRLTDKEKKILIDHYWGGRSNPEIASEFGCTPANISAIKRNALSKLRRDIRLAEFAA